MFFKVRQFSVGQVVAVFYHIIDFRTVGGACDFHSHFFIIAVIALFGAYGNDRFRCHRTLLQCRLNSSKDFSAFFLMTGNGCHAFHALFQINLAEQFRQKGCVCFFAGIIQTDFGQIVFLVKIGAFKLHSCGDAVCLSAELPQFIGMFGIGIGKNISACHCFRAFSILKGCRFQQNYSAVSICFIFRLQFRAGILMENRVFGRCRAFFRRLTAVCGIVDNCPFRRFHGDKNRIDFSVGCHLSGALESGWRNFSRAFPYRLAAQGVNDGIFYRITGEGRAADGVHLFFFLLRRCGACLQHFLQCLSFQFFRHAAWAHDITAQPERFVNGAGNLRAVIFQQSNPAIYRSHAHLYGIGLAFIAFALRLPCIYLCTCIQRRNLHESQRDFQNF